MNVLTFKFNRLGDADAFRVWCADEDFCSTLKIIEYSKSYLVEVFAEGNIEQILDIWTDYLVQAGAFDIPISCLRAEIQKAG